MADHLTETSGMVSRGRGGVGTPGNHVCYDTTATAVIPSVCASWLWRYVLADTACPPLI